jgi:radical SAM protein
MGHHHGSANRDYSLTPLNVYWEMTQACALACRHCRAEAVPEAHPNELKFDDGIRLMDQILGFGDPLPQLILTGGDPLRRPDLHDIIREARKRGIGVSITPAATPALTREVLEKLVELGVDGLGLSLDGSSADKHDSIRGVPGTFDRTVQAMRWAQELKMPLQVNTLVSAETAHDLPGIYEVLKPLGLARWSLFFLIAVGRGKVLAPLEPAEAEEVMRWIFETSKTAPFVVSTTEAPSYRRVAIEQMKADGMTGEQIRRSPAYRAFGIRDGHGIMFVSHTGEICPAGFLPVGAGNILKNELSDIYRNSDVFHALHDPTQFEDRCGQCEYHALCGGSRARAFEATGSYLATDPLCLYEPHSHSHSHAVSPPPPSTGRPGERG